MGEGGEVSIPVDGVREPRSGACVRRPARARAAGNKHFTEGDTIPRLRGGGGGGSEGAEDGGGEDDFRFVLSQDEFLDLSWRTWSFRPGQDPASRTLENPAWRRAGYSTSGSPANLSLTRTMRNSLSRRIALSPEIRGDEEMRGGIARLEALATSPSEWPCCASSSRASSAGASSSPLSIRSTCAIASSRPDPSRSPRR